MQKMSSDLFHCFWFVLFPSSVPIGAIFRKFDDRGQQKIPPYIEEVSDIERSFFLRLDELKAGTWI